MKNRLVTTELLGKTLISDQAYTNSDDSPLAIDKDFLGKPRNKRNPTAGPFEDPGQGNQKIKIWKIF